MFKRVLKYYILFFLIASVSLSAAEPRKPAVAGGFYPANADELRSTITSFLNKVPPQEVPGELIGLIAPHAGYIYSGEIAAYSFKQLENKEFDTIIILGLAHHYPIGKSIAVSSVPYQTPLGIVATDAELVRQLVAANPIIKDIPLAHAGEHSLEVELPFLQMVLDDFKIVPILIQEYDLETLSILAEAIKASIKNKKVLLLSSADLSHYPTGPTADKIDRQILSAIETIDAKLILSTSNQIMNKNEPEVSCTICAQGAVLATVMTARLLGADHAQILAYANSGDTAGDDSRVVGYGAVIITKKTNNKIYINEKEQKELLTLARQSIKEYFKTKKMPDFTTTKQELIRKSGVFVTLKKAGNLRGCIGHIQPVESLHIGVANMARASAFNDTRFQPVIETELDELVIEISVLSPLKKVASAEEIVLGRDGVVVKRGFNSGIFLPQVALETGWTKEEFLGHLCQDKAGLWKDAWQDPDTELYTFTVQKFSE